MNDNGSLSRATSISRASKQGSTASRNQSLIRKNIAPHDLKPSDVLIERFVSWKVIAKQLISYFEGIADIENNIAKELTRLTAVIQVPFRSGNQFLGEGGLQDIYYGIRDKTRLIADQHANLGRTVEGSIVQHLQKVRTEIKAHIKNIQNDTGKLAISVAKERELSTRYIADLTISVSSYKNTPMAVTPRGDPYIANVLVARQLFKQVHEENLLQKSIVIMQQNSAHFEEAIVRSLQSAWQTFYEWQVRAYHSNQESLRDVTQSMAHLAPDREWISFSAREDHLLDPDTPLRDPANINYPSMDDPAVVPVHVGNLERKKRYTRTYKENYFVLTPAGFLHEYASSDPSTPGGQSVLFSLFLPACTLGPPGMRTNKFHVEETKDGVGTTKGGSFRRSLGGGVHAWTFRAKSKEDMMEWWNDIRMLCARYLVASEQIARTGPVVEVVRAVGYVGGGEEGEEGEGSSAEELEEGEEARGDEGGEDDKGEETLPDNSQRLNYQNQYQRPEKPQDGPRPEGHRDTDDHSNAHVRSNGTQVLSKRQQEKAHEKYAPHEHEQAEHSQDREGSPTPGPAPVESRFTEGL